MIKFIKQVVIIFTFYCFGIFGAWLGGAEITPWAFALGGFFALALPIVARIVDKNI